jgi:hypothetical protein
MLFLFFNVMSSIFRQPFFSNGILSGCIFNNCGIPCARYYFREAKTLNFEFRYAEPDGFLES